MLSELQDTFFNPFMNSNDRVGLEFPSRDEVEERNQWDRAGDKLDAIMKRSLKKWTVENHDPAFTHLKKRNREDSPNFIHSVLVIRAIGLQSLSYDLLSCLSSFLNFKKMEALGLLNKEWAQKMYSRKRDICSISFIGSLRILKILEKPITLPSYLELHQIKRFFNTTTLPFLKIQSLVLDLGDEDLKVCVDSLKKGLVYRRNRLVRWDDGLIGPDDDKIITSLLNQSPFNKSPTIRVTHLLEKIARDLPNLQELSFKSCYGITKQQFTTLSNLSLLNKISLHCNSDVLKEITLTRFPLLKDIDLSLYSNATNDKICHLANLTSLQKISIGPTWGEGVKSTHFRHQPAIL